MRRILAMTAQRGQLSAKQTITAKKIIYELNKQSVLVLDNFFYYQSIQSIVSYSGHRLMWSRLMELSVNEIKMNQMYQSLISLLFILHVSSSFAYCYHPVNVISLGLAQCDPFKWRLFLYSNSSFPTSTWMFFFRQWWLPWRSTTRRWRRTSSSSSSGRGGTTARSKKE